MKRLLFPLIFLLAAFSNQSCDRELISSGFPNVMTLSPEDQGDKLVFTGEVRNEAKIVIDEVGFIWQNTEDPFSKPGFQMKTDVSASGTFTAEVNWSITNDRNYVLRAYAKCGEKTVYGEPVVFKPALVLPCQLVRIEPDSAFRGDTIKLIGRGFNRTLQFNQVLIDGKNASVLTVNDSVLTCIVPSELTKGLKTVNIKVNGINGNFGTIFRLLLPPPPHVVTKNARNISYFSAKLDGSVDPNGLTCNVSFEYGLTTSYGSSANAVPLTVSGDTVTNVTATPGNLTPNTLYHYRVKAVSESGTSYGEDMTFQTIEAPPVPLISSLSSTTVKYGNTLTVHGHNMSGVTEVLLGGPSQSVTVVPKTRTPESMEIEVYNQQNPYQLLGFSSFRVGLVHPGGVTWSDQVNIVSSWTRLADFPGSARYKAGCFTIGGSIYTGCGASEGVPLKDFWKYDPISNTWRRMSDFPGVQRIYPLATADNTYGYMGTGHTADNSTRTQLYDFYAYNPGTDLWSAIPNYPDPINNFFFNYAVTVNGRAYFSISNVVQYIREIISNTWVSHPNVTDLMDSPSNAVFVLGDSYYVITGIRTNYTSNKAVWEYNTLTSSWARKADFPGNARNSTMFFSIGNYGYIGCGANHTTQQFNDMWRYDPAKDKWIRVEDFPGGLRSHIISASVGNTGFTGLGVKLSPVIYYNDFWKFDPETH